MKPKIDSNDMDVLSTISDELQEISGKYSDADSLGDAACDVEDYVNSHDEKD